MRIEVAVADSASSTRQKGDLLEELASTLLKTQNYIVANQVRLTATELDLLCTHKVNRKQIYVECKAYRETLSATVLKTLLGTVVAKDFQEGWLISTGSLGKDAKGFQHDWEQRPTVESQKLSIYTPERVIEALIDARIIKTCPVDMAINIIQDEELLGEWVLLITEYGKYWITTCLSGGIPAGVLIFSATSGKIVDDATLLQNLARTDTTLNSLDFEFIRNYTQKSLPRAIKTYVPQVVEVQHGDSWADYRPARPEDFVGRQDTQMEIIHFFGSIRERRIRTRVFAITGDSGMGKSSLIAKLRAQLQNQRYRRRYFLYAVDMRAATGSNYIFEALLTCLRKAAELGFGNGDANSLKVSSTSEPIETDSIQSFLTSLELKKQVVCLVFDQFEELYSKPDLFEVFETAQRLLLSATSVQSNLVLGFAWKTDSTLQQEHPAYFMWHRLADHRHEVRLGRFMHSEASGAITIFEKELGQTLRSELRRQLIENSQGYPWLLKKLSIHVYEQIKSGTSQFEILDRALDVKSLFERDIQVLSPAESTCLRLIAKSAPADWYEILDASDPEVVRGLQDKRLIIRSGDRLNIYWDIFREYILTGTVPSIPLTYLPTSPSLKKLLAVAQQLDATEYCSFSEIASRVSISEKSVGNVVRDLSIFGIATRNLSQVKLDSSMSNSTPQQVMLQLRKVFRNHALTVSIAKMDKGVIISSDDIIKLLRSINPAAQHREDTWQIYAERMAHWLTATGYLVPVVDGWKVEDQGDIAVNTSKLSSQRSHTHKSLFQENVIFFADATPNRTVETLEWLRVNPHQTWNQIEIAGHRNSARTLTNLRLLQSNDGKYFSTVPIEDQSKTTSEIVWRAALNDPSLQKVITYLKSYPLASGTAVGHYISKEFQRKWSNSTIEKVGGRLIKWAHWLVEHTDDQGAFKLAISDENIKSGEQLPLIF